MAVSPAELTDGGPNVDGIKPDKICFRPALNTGGSPRGGWPGRWTLTKPPIHYLVTPLASKGM